MTQVFIPMRRRRFTKSDISWDCAMFGGMQDLNGCSVDDFIDDTPNAVAATRGCPIGANTCNTDNLPDQVENYMDYGSDVCANMFTKQQVAVMRYNLVNLREGLGAPEVLYRPIPEIGEFKLYPNPATTTLKFFSEDIFDE